jgi:hypothetical protein
MSPETVEQAVAENGRTVRAFVNDLPNRASQQQEENREKRTSRKRTLKRRLNRISGAALSADYLSVHLFAAASRAFSCASI